MHSPGTLQYLKLITKRKFADGNWKRSFSANERFLKDTVAVHAVGFALRHFGMTSVKDAPNVTPFNQSLPKLPTKDDWNVMTLTARRAWFNAHIDKIVADIWSFSLIDTTVEAPKKARRPPQKPRFSCARCDRPYVAKSYLLEHGPKCEGNPTTSEPTVGSDGKYEYALRYLNLGLLYLAFRDAICFGNGPACVNFYRWILPLARAQSSASKYAHEALYLHACALSVIRKTGP